jgi:hypothetical protein
MSIDNLNLDMLLRDSKKWPSGFDQSHGQNTSIKMKQLAMYIKVDISNFFLGILLFSRLKADSAIVKNIIITPIIRISIASALNRPCRNAVDFLGFS